MMQLAYHFDGAKTAVEFKGTAGDAALATLMLVRSVYAAMTPSQQAEYRAFVHRMGTEDDCPCWAADGYVPDSGNVCVEPAL